MHIFQNRNELSQTGREKDAHIESISFESKQPFIYEVKIRGSDYIGSWDGIGQFINTRYGPLFWMLKYYDNAEEARQTGQHTTLVYKTTEFGRIIKGKWFYDKF